MRRTVVKKMTKEALIVAEGNLAVSLERMFPVGEGDDDADVSAEPGFEVAEATLVAAVPVGPGWVAPQFLAQASWQGWLPAVHLDAHSVNSVVHMK